MTTSKANTRLFDPQEVERCSRQRKRARSSAVDGSVYCAPPVDNNASSSIRPQKLHADFVLEIKFPSTSVPAASELKQLS
jgi:hypothetical protein